MSTRIAHISDIHVPPSGAIPWSHLLNKRITGLVNLRTFRKQDHPIELCTKLVAALAADKLDHVVLTGDLTNLALDDEFARAKEVLKPLLDSNRLTAIPGNHDKYVQAANRHKRFEFYFDSAMTTDSDREHDYPFVKQIGNVAILGLNSAIKTPPLTSYGLVDSGQRERLVQFCTSPELLSSFKIVLLHHNLHARSSSFKDWSSGLHEKDAFIDSLFEGKVNLVLHGHTHVAHRTRLERDGHAIQIIGCGSSTWNRPEHLARYNIYEVQNEELKRIECRVFDPERSEFIPQQELLTVDKRGL